MVRDCRDITYVEDRALNYISQAKPDISERLFKSYVAALGAVNVIMFGDHLQICSAVICNLRRKRNRKEKYCAKSGRNLSISIGKSGKKTSLPAILGSEPSVVETDLQSFYRGMLSWHVRGAYLHTDAITAVPAPPATLSFHLSSPLQRDL
ncbi:unnamed protein product [Victoria cruziana]